MEFKYEVIEGNKATIETTLLARKGANRGLVIEAMCWNGTQYAVLISYVTP